MIARYQGNVESIVLQNLSVQKCEKRTAAHFLEQFHYDKFGRGATQTYSASVGDKIISVCKFCTQGRQGSAKSLGLQCTDILELDRFCIHVDYHKKNLASHLMGRYLKLLRSDYPHIKAVISFADPAAGHDGTIYKASNWKPLGMTGKSYYYLDRDGRIIKKKAFYNHIRKHRIMETMSESEAAVMLGLAKVLTPPKMRFAYFF